MNEEGDEPVRWMARVYAREIIIQASNLLIAESAMASIPGRAEEFADAIEVALKQIRFNLKDKAKPLSKPTETTPDR